MPTPGSGARPGTCTLTPLLAPTPIPRQRLLRIRVLLRVRRPPRCTRPLRARSCVPRWGLSAPAGQPMARRRGHERRWWRRRKAFFAAYSRRIARGGRLIGAFRAAEPGKAASIRCCRAAPPSARAFAHLDARSNVHPPCRPTLRSRASLRRRRASRAACLQPHRARARRHRSRAIRRR